MDPMEFSAYGIGLVPLIVGIALVINKLGLPKRWVPLLDLILGLLLGVAYLSDGDIKKGILIGLWLGLAATGMNQGVGVVKNGDNGVRKNKKR